MIAANEHLPLCCARCPARSKPALLIKLDGARSSGWRSEVRMLDSRQIAELQDEATTRWHSADSSEALSFPSDSLLSVVLAQHRANFDLWHEEDKAREPEVSDSSIAAVKHNIDALNQTRNDLMETIDRTLLEAAGEQNCSAPLQSETPGLMIDRLSILALKIYHTAEEAQRASASEAHRERNATRLAMLKEQRSDLATCLNTLWNEVLQGRRRFKLYRQMKMYNDPELNPKVYSHKRHHPPS